MEPSAGPVKTELPVSFLALDQPKSPWGQAPSPVKPTPVSLTDVMSEQLATQLHEEESSFDDQVPKASSDVQDASVDAIPETGEDLDTSNDYLLAQALQHEFDREHDQRLSKEEAKYNGKSKVSLSFSNYRTTHPFLDDDESESDDEECWVDKEKDTVVRFDKRGISGKGKKITTKHDAALSATKNANKIMNFPPTVETGDVSGQDFQLNNRVYNSLKQHSMGEQKRLVRLHEKKENATTEQAVDPKTRLMMYKLINANILESVSGVISTGKESAIFHAHGGCNKEVPVPIPAECVIKVFKTTLNEFHTRSQYVKGDYRFSKDEFKKKNPRKIIKIWTEKELLNLRKMRRAGIRCPEPIMLRKHLLLMSFIGEEQIPAKKLKHVKLDEKEWATAYKQTYNAMRVMYRDARLVHADLSEYNLLYHRGDVWVIDVSQAVDLAHPKAHEFLLRDCKNISQFFTERGVKHVPTQYQLFNDVSGLSFTGEDAEFLSQIQDYEDKEVWMSNDAQRKNYQFDYFFNKESANRTSSTNRTSTTKSQSTAREKQPPLHDIDDI